VVDDALVGGLEEQALAATVVAARMALPGGEQVAERVHTIGRLDAIPPVGPRRRRDERRDDLALPRLPLGVDPRFLALGAAPFAVLVIVVADARDPANHEDGDRAARKPACPAAPPAGVDAAKRPTSAEEQEQHAHHLAGLARGQQRLRGPAGALRRPRGAGPARAAGT